MPSTTSNIDLKIFIGMGLVALVLMFSLPLFLGFVTVLKYQGEPAGKQAQPADMYNEPLGELNSHCGGPSRLPCRPGLSCSNDQGIPNSIGTCIVSAATTTATYVPGQLNQTCNLSQSPACTVGLYCKKINSTSQTGTCLKIDATAPHVLSISFQGLQPSEGWYVGKVGTKATINLETVNADSVSIILSKVEGGGQLAGFIGNVQSLKGGKYSAPFTVPAGLRAELLVTVTSKTGGTSSLSVNVASVQ
jgi:hypothetical protein